MVPENDANEQTDIRGCEIEQHKHQDEPRKLAPRRNQPSHRIHDQSHDDGRKQSQGNDIKHHLGGEVGDGMVVSIGSLANKQKSLCREHRQTGESAEPKQSKDKEKETQSVLETLDIVGQSVEQISTQNT